MLLVPTAADVTGLVLSLVLLAAALYAVYWVVRKAVAHGVRDARRGDGADSERVGR